MGIFLDTVEDTNEAHWQWVGGTARTVAARDRTVQLPPAVVGLTCPYCGQVFEDDRSLHSHCRREHAGRVVYLRVNGHVVRGGTVTERDLRSLELVVEGLDSVHVSVGQSGAPERSFEATRTTDLLAIAQLDPEQSVEISVAGPQVESVYTVLVAHRGSFDSVPVDRDAHRLLFVPLAAGGAPDFEMFSATRCKVPASTLQEVYANGLLEYALGCRLEQQDRSVHAKPRLEAALQILHPFDTDFARTAVRALALRTCNAPRLSVVGPPSRFAVANHFLNHFAANGATTAELPGATQSSPDYGVYVDPSLQAYLDAVEQFYRRRFDLVEQSLDGLDWLERRDQNWVVLLRLLRARCLTLQGRVGEAARFYRVLEGHPYLGAEARAARHASEVS